MKFYQKNHIMWLKPHLNFKIFKESITGIFIEYRLTKKMKSNNNKLLASTKKQIEECLTSINKCCHCGSPANAFVTENYNFQIHCLESGCPVKVIMQSQDRNFKKLIESWNSKNNEIFLQQQNELIESIHENQ